LLELRPEDLRVDLPDDRPDAEREDEEDLREVPPERLREDVEEPRFVEAILPPFQVKGWPRLALGVPPTRASSLRSARG